MISISLESVEPALCDAIHEDDPYGEDYLDEER
jgi:hypothetical protein